jgi:anti-sigma factor RsiW
MADMSEEEMLFGYAAGGLDAQARARVEAALAADPALRERLQWYEAVCDSLVESFPDLPAYPDADAIVARVRGARPKPGFFEWLGGRALRPAAALAAVLIVAQGALIALLALERPEHAATRSSAAVGNAAVFVIAFDPAAPEGKIRSLLIEAGASVIDGPQQLGEYRIWVPANRAQFAHGLFSTSPIVEYVRPEGPGGGKKW